MKTKILATYKKLAIPIKASFWFLICGIAEKGVSVVTTPIFTRLFTTKQYGYYNIYQSWLAIFAVFATLRLSLGVYTRGLVKFEDDKDRFSSSMQGLSTLCILFVFAIYLIFHKFWNHITGLTTVMMIAMFVSIWATESFSFWSMRQRIRYKYRLLILVTLFVTLAKPVSGIIAVLSVSDEYKVLARILTLAGVELLAYAALNFIQWHKCRNFYSKKYWKYALKFNIPLIPHYLSQIVLNQSDRIMIEKMTNVSQAGIYSLAYSLSMLMLIVNTAILNTLNPWIYQSIKKKEYFKIGKTSYAILCVVAIANIMLIALAPEMVYIFAPTQYREAIWIIPPIAMSVYFIFTYSLFANFEFYFEKTKFIMAASVMAALLNIGLNFIGIKIFGYMAAGYTTLICYILYALGHYFFMKKTCKEFIGTSKIYNQSILLLISVGFVLVGFIFMLLYPFMWLRFALILLIAILIVWKRNRIFALIKMLRSAK